MADELVLFADDDEDIRTFIVRALSRAGFRVLPAADAAAAAEHLMVDTARAIKVLIVDHNMPGERGFPFVRRLRAVRPDVKAIVVSGEDLTPYVLPGEEIHFLQKPFVIHEFVALMRGLLG